MKKLILTSLMAVFLLGSVSVAAQDTVKKEGTKTECCSKKKDKSCCTKDKKENKKSCCSKDKKSK